MNSIQEIPEVDTCEFWLDLPKDHKDYNSKPKKALNCKSNCGNKLESIFTKRLIRIASFSDFIGIDYFDYHGMCDLCKKSVYNWFYSDVWSDYPEYSSTFDNFEAEIEENNAALMMNGAYEQYQKMLEDYHNDDVEGPVGTYNKKTYARMSIRTS